MSPMSPRLLRPRASGGWTPAQLGSALSLWFDAADASTITLNGSTVSQWSDKSGNSRNLSQSTASKQPTYETNKLNGRPAILFDGTSDILATDSAGAAGVTNSSIWMVMRYVSASGDDVAASIGRQTSPSSGNGTVRVFYRSSTTQGVSAWATDVLTTAYAVDAGGSYHMFAFRQTGITVQVRRNGSGTNYTYGGISPQAVVHNDFSIGSMNGAFESSFLSNISVAEVVVLYSYASDANTALIEQYLSSKWGIALA